MIVKDTRQVVTEYMEAMCKPDFEAAFSMFDPKGTYTIIGNSPLSRTFNGIDEINNELCGLLATGFKTIPEIVTEAIIIDGDRGVALAHGWAEGKYGRYQQDHYAFVFRVKDGKVIEKIEFLDPSQLDIAVFGRKWAEPVAA